MISFDKEKGLQLSYYVQTAEKEISKSACTRGKKMTNWRVDQRVDTKSAPYDSPALYAYHARDCGRGAEKNLGAGDYDQLIGGYVENRG